MNDRHDKRFFTAVSATFAHDGFARMTTDAGAGLTVGYNSFDLPQSVHSGGTLMARYAYTADGTKVSALDASGAGLVYRGPFTYRRSAGGTLTLEGAPFDGGRLTEAGARYQVTDHLGSVRAVWDGTVSATSYPLAGFYSMDDYAQYGVKSASGAASSITLKPTGSTVSLRDGFTGQEDQAPDFSVPYLDFGARQYSPSLSRWLVPDPMGEKYYDISPYAYCAGNPVSLVDLGGMSTHVISNPDGSYQVVGGDETDEDLSVYCGHFEDGVFIKDSVIGVTTSITTFFDSESNKWQSVIIDMNDDSGVSFFNSIINDTPALIDYMLSAGNYELYDFKSTNGTNTVLFKMEQYYRGMTLGNGIITSARDVGNMVAGYMCGVNGIPYGCARFALDLYESYTATISKYVHSNDLSIMDCLTLSKEGKTTTNAQYLGWLMGRTHRQMKH